MKLSLFQLVLAGAHAVVASTVVAQPVDANSPASFNLQAYGEKMLENHVRGKIYVPLVLQAIKEQNQRHEGISQQQIDDMDKKWRAEMEQQTRPTVDALMANDVSKFLTKLQEESKGELTELFVMDKYGLNVGQSVVTSDYWQGDEDKYQQTFLKGPDAMFIDQVEFDDATQAFQFQSSMTVHDPDSGESIGVITISVNAEEL